MITLFLKKTEVKNLIDKVAVVYLAFVLAIIGSIIYMIATGKDDMRSLGLVMLGLVMGCFLLSRCRHNDV